MQQRRPRLGDILDDYCPRERRITNHAVVAMIDDGVKQTRCTTCDAEHEYKEARIPTARRKKTGALFSEVLENARPRAVTAAPASASALPQSPADDDTFDEPLAPSVEADEASHDALAADALAADASVPEGEPRAGGEDEWPVHRRLIRATLPRPEGQVPERKAPELTMHQPGREANGNRAGRRGHRPMRQAQGGQGGSHGGHGQQRFGQRHGSGHGHGQSQGQPQRNGNRTGGSSGQRNGRPGGSNRGPGRKRGR